MARPSAPANLQLYVNATGVVERFFAASGWKIERSPQTATTLISAGFTPSAGIPLQYLDDTVLPPRLVSWNGTTYISRTEYKWGIGTESPSTPGSPGLGSRWLDTTTAAPVLKYWNGSSWIVETVGNIGTGDRFYAVNTSRAWVYTSTPLWVLASNDISIPRRSTLLAPPANGLPKLYSDDFYTPPVVMFWDQAINAYSPMYTQFRYGYGVESTSTPGSPVVGSTWLDITAPSFPLLKQWSGAAWTTITPIGFGERWFGSNSGNEWYWTGTVWKTVTGDIDVFNWTNASPVVGTGFGAPPLVVSVPIDNYYRLDSIIAIIPPVGLQLIYVIKCSTSNVGAGDGTGTYQRPVDGSGTDTAPAAWLTMQRNAQNPGGTSWVCYSGTNVYGLHSGIGTTVLNVYAVANTGVTAAPGSCRISLFMFKKKNALYA